MNVEDQPPPVRNEGKPVWEMVIEDVRQRWRLHPSLESVLADMQARDRIGRERYGTPLQTKNGRDPLIDAYQEALDLAVYLRQATEEGVEDLREVYGSTIANIFVLRRLIAER